MSLRRTDGNTSPMREWESWAQIIASRAALPAIFRDSIPADGALPYTVHLPDVGLGLRREKLKLVCLYSDCISIPENARSGAIVSVNYHLDSIHRIIHGTIFLHSWIELHGLVEGKPKASTITYNTIGEDALKPIIAALRKSTRGAKGGRSSRPEFAFLNRANLKFYRYISAEVLPDETVAQVLYQPELRARALHIFPRVLVPRHIVVLTDKEIVLMRDADWRMSKASGRFSYGIVRSFIPLKDVEDATVAASDRAGVARLSIILPHEEVRLPFDSRLNEDLRAFQKAILDRRDHRAASARPVVDS